MPAHNLLWRECEKSSDNVTARLAVIPLVQVISCCWLCKFVLDFMSELFKKMLLQLFYCEAVCPSSSFLFLNFHCLLCSLCVDFSLVPFMDLYNCMLYLFNYYYFLVRAILWL